MGQAQFKRRVDYYLAQNYTLNEAIAAAADDAAHYVDPIVTMRQQALDNGARLL